MNKNTSLKKKRVVLGMSGGVDSSVSLMLLKQAGYDVTGVSLRYETYYCSKRKENVCCSKESFDIAKKVCSSFGVDHVELNVSKNFAAEVIGYFESELKKNRTPSPCVFCNPKVKFFSLVRYADEIGAEFVATGHYCRIEKGNFGGKRQWLLKKGIDKSKDQTYSLAFLPKKLLSRLVFPLGQLTKDQVYSLAKKHKILKIYKKIKQSQDFCFLDKSEYPIFIKREIKPTAGKIVNTEGSIIGDHEGLAYYTLGQRKGIKLPGGPYYVVKKQLPSTLVVSKDKNASMTSKSSLSPFNLLIETSEKELNVLVKARSSEKLKKAKIKIAKGKIELSYAKPVLLVPGQVAVFYKGSICLGGGVIN